MSPSLSSREPEQDAGNRLFARPCQFLTGATNPQQLPSPDRPEIAFAGRSNVGKSSLLNALTGRRALARTSNTPGRTQEINYFGIGDGTPEAFYLVDLPGYGYARNSKAKAADWTRFVMNYLQSRASLHRVFLLLDSRHGMMGNDQKVMEILDKAGVSYAVVLTKADKCRGTYMDTRLAETRTLLHEHVAAHPEILTVSSRKKTGLEPLRNHIAALVTDA